MGLTTALYTGLSGINVNQSRINTIGDNIANVNTTAFKGSRTLFQTQFSQTLSLGNAPSDTSGGTNPTQIGLGAVVGATQRNMNQGSIETTGIASDLALQGSGFFLIRRPNGQQVYTRDGSFTLSPDNRLVTANGAYVQGFGVDSSFNIIPGVVQDLTVPVGTLSLARATSLVQMDGDLSAAGTVATQSSESVTQPLVAGGGGQAGAGTALTDLRSGSNPGVPLFAAGNTITVRGVVKGDRELPPADFVVGADGNTLGDFASWLQNTLGIQTGAGLPGNPGVTIENGALVVRSNAGEQNSITISSDDMLSDNPGVTQPFQFTQTAEATGSGVFTSFLVYDSLGTPVQVNLTYALEQLDGAGAVWRFYAEQANPDGTARALGTGTVAFDVQGNVINTTGNQFSIDRAAAGAASPLTFTVDMTGLHGLSTLQSNVVMAAQDGFPPGTLTNFGVGEDGSVIGIFSNGLTRTLGQVAVAVVPNPAGLVSDGQNTYLLGPNAGNPAILAPGQGSAGTILSGALELSNVDLSQEFIGLITSSTGFQASSRVITVSRDLLEQLLLVMR
jgi:flagellar hook protein FlgE